jgi:hypothetical protein
MHKTKRKLASKVGLVGLFQVNWKTPHHALLVEFLNNWKEHKRKHIFAHIGEKVVVIDVHTIGKVLEINSKGWREQKYVEMNFITI